MLRTLVPEKFPDFVVAQVILQTITGFSLYIRILNFLESKEFKLEKIYIVICIIK